MDMADDAGRAEYESPPIMPLALSARSQLRAV
jgi:hypothetical protein